jgi:hypothetical protein
MQLLMEQILSQVNDTLSKTPEEHRIFEKSVNYYSSCIDTDTIRSRGFSPIIPMANSFAAYFKKYQNFTKALGKMNRNAVYFLFKTTYSKVENADPNDLRLQFFPSVAYDVTVTTVKRALQPFLDNGILVVPPNTSLDAISEWIVKVEKTCIEFIHTLK